MADDGLKLELNQALSERLKEAADAAGRPVDAFAAELIADGLDGDWAESYARFAEYKRTGEYLDAPAVMETFRKTVAACVRAQRS